MDDIDIRGGYNPHKSITSPNTLAEPLDLPYTFIEISHLASLVTTKQTSGDNWDTKGNIDTTNKTARTDFTCILVQAKIHDPIRVKFAIVRLGLLESSALTHRAVKSPSLYCSPLKMANSYCLTAI